MGFLEQWEKIGKIKKDGKIKKQAGYFEWRNYPAIFYSFFHRIQITVHITPAANAATPTTI